MPNTPDNRTCHPMTALPQAVAVPRSAPVRESEAVVLSGRDGGRLRPGVHGALLRAVAVLLALGAPLLATACGASPVSAAAPSRVASSRVAGAQTAVTCTRVADVLSDGPDPTVDPVGYALAQVLPLREITTSDRALERDIRSLASAYAAVYKTNNSKGSEATVEKAGKALDTICPGAF